MAQVVLGAGSSHSPMVSMTGPDWLEWGERDRRHTGLYTRDGEHLTYEEQLARAGDTLAPLATAERCEAGAVRVGAAVDALRAAIAAARLDAVVIVGDDQDEHLLADNLPPFLVYWGETITNAGIDGLADLPPLAQHYLPGYREPGGSRDYAVATELARHLIAEAMTHGFDVAASRELPRPDRGMGHAFGFPLRRLLDAPVPIVPVMVNTYNPPTRPTASRCAAFGAMLRAAIDGFPGGERIGVIASGGLSHFVVLERLDREVLAALEAGDLDALTSVAEATFVSGTSEIKNWITVAAMLADFAFETVDYVPGYRTPAGTGTGLAFGLWRPA